MIIENFLEGGASGRKRFGEFGGPRLHLDQIMWILGVPFSGQRVPCIYYGERWKATL
jgi:hypothetical protein